VEDELHQHLRLRDFTFLPLNVFTDFSQMSAWPVFIFSHNYPTVFKEIYCTDSTYSVYKDKLQNVPVTNLNKYLHYGTSGTE